MVGYVLFIDEHKALTPVEKLHLWECPLFEYYNDISIFSDKQNCFEVILNDVGIGDNSASFFIHIPRLWLATY